MADILQDLGLSKFDCTGASIGDTGSGIGGGCGANAGCGEGKGINPMGPVLAKDLLRGGEGGFRLRGISLVGASARSELSSGDDSCKPRFTRHLRALLKERLITADPRLRCALNKEIMRVRDEIRGRNKFLRLAQGSDKGGSFVEGPSNRTETRIVTDVLTGKEYEIEKLPSPSRLCALGKEGIEGAEKHEDPYVIEAPVTLTARQDGRGGTSKRGVSRRAQVGGGNFTRPKELDQGQNRGRDSDDSREEEVLLSRSLLMTLMIRAGKGRTRASPSRRAVPSGRVRPGRTYWL